MKGKGWAHGETPTLDVAEVVRLLEKVIAELRGWDIPDPGRAVRTARKRYGQLQLGIASLRKRAQYVVPHVADLERWPEAGLDYTKASNGERPPMPATMECRCCRAKVRTLFLDHDHDTGWTRGYVCPRCNNLIGLYEHGRLSKANELERNCIEGFLARVSEQWALGNG